MTWIIALESRNLKYRVCMVPIGWVYDAAQFGDQGATTLQFSPSQRQRLSLVRYVPPHQRSIWACRADGFAERRQGKFALKVLLTFLNRHRRAKRTVAQPR
jgi:hypothetical protein